MSSEKDAHRDSASDDGAKTQVTLTAQLHPACVLSLYIVFKVLFTLLDWKDLECSYVLWCTVSCHLPGISKLLDSFTFAGQPTLQPDTISTLHDCAPLNAKLLCRTVTSTY